MVALRCTLDINVPNLPLKVLAKVPEKNTKTKNHKSQYREKDERNDSKSIAKYTKAKSVPKHKRTSW